MEMASVQIKVRRPGLARMGMLIALLFLAQEAWGFSLGDDDIVSVSGCGAEGGSVAECAQNYLVDKAAGKLQDETISAGVDQLRKRGAKHLAEATETVHKKGVAGAFVDGLGDVARKANNKTLGAAAKAARRALTAVSKAVPALNAAATGAEIGWVAGSAISENVVQPKMEAHYADQDRRFREEALSQTEFLKANKNVAREYSKRLRSNGPEAADLYLEAQMDRRGEPEYTLEEPSDGGSTSDESNVVADGRVDLRNSFDEPSDEEKNYHRKGEPVYALEEPSNGGSTSDESNLVADRHADLRNSFDELSDEETNFDRKMEEAPRIAKSEAASDGWRSTLQYRQPGRPPPSWGPGNEPPRGGRGAEGLLESTAGGGNGIEGGGFFGDQKGFPELEPELLSMLPEYERQLVESGQMCHSAKCADINIAFLRALDEIEARPNVGICTYAARAWEIQVLQIQSTERCLLRVQSNASLERCHLETLELTKEAAHESELSANALGCQTEHLKPQLCRGGSRRCIYRPG